MGAKPLRVRFNKIDRFVKICNGTRYLEIFGSSLYYEIHNRIRYLISEKSGTADSINHRFAKTKIDSYNSLLIEKILTFHVIILIKSVVNKNKNQYYYNMFLEKGSYKDNPIHNIFT